MLATAVPLALGAPRAAAQPGDVTERFDVVLRVREDGDMDVTERIQQRFNSPRRGIIRLIPERQELGDRRYRSYPIEGVSVVAEPVGTPYDLKVAKEGSTRQIRVGNPDVRITGVRTYTVRYPRPQRRDALRGSRRAVLERAAVRVGAADPGRLRAGGDAASVTRIRCVVGRTGTQDPCPTATSEGGVASFAAQDLSRGEGMSVTIATAPGSLTVNPIITEEDPPLLAIVKNSWLAVPALAVGAAALYRRAMSGRDRAFAGLPLEASRGEPGTALRRPMRRGEDREGPVELGPPEDLPPALIGAIDELGVDSDHLTATILDLAMRGYLTITEEDKSWRLSAGSDEPRVAAASGKRQQDTPTKWEQELLSNLFRDGSSVLLKDLNQKFAARYVEFRNGVLDDVVARGWVTSHPMKASSKLSGPAVLLGIAAGVAFFASGRFVAVRVLGGVLARCSP